jgi:hypothetical protein
MLLGALRRVVVRVCGGRQPATCRGSGTLVGFERLEDRRVLSATPLSIGGLQSFTWLDPDGDAVEVSIQGSAGELTFSEDNSDAFGNNDGTLEDGENPALLSVTGASGDFRIEATYRTDIGIGDGLVTLGRLEAIDQAFAGVAAKSDTATLRLNGLVAAGFADGTGLSVDELAGDLILRKLGALSFVDVEQSATGRIILRDGMEGDIRIGGDLRDNLVVGGPWGTTASVEVGGVLTADVQVLGNLAGDLTVGSEWHGRLVVTQRFAAESEIAVGKSFNGDVDVVGGFDGVLRIQDAWTGDLKVAGDFAASALIRTGGDQAGAATFFGRFWGQVDVGMRARGNWNVHGVVGGTARISAGAHFDNFHASRSFFGDVSVGGSVTLFVDGHLGATTLIESERTNVQVGGTFYGDATATLSVHTTANRGLNPQVRLQAPTVFVVTPRGATGRAEILTDDLQRRALPSIDSSNLLIGQGPFVIVRSGVYRLMNDVTFPAARGNAISVRADDVTIDMNGFTITGTAGSGSSAIGIRGDKVSGTTIRNGTIRGFFFGAILSGPDHVIDCVWVDANWYFGVWVVGPNAGIRDSFITNTGGSTVGPQYTVVIAARLVGNDSHFAGNVILGMRRSPVNIELVGLHVDSAPNSTVSRNVFHLQDTGNRSGRPCLLAGLR